MQPDNIIPPNFMQNVGMFVYSHILWIVLICLFGAAMSFLISILANNKHRIRLFYLPSEREGELKFKKAPDITKVQFRKKMYDLSKVKPVMIKSILGRVPLYFVDHLSTHGLEFDMSKKKIENKYMPENIDGIVETTLVKEFLAETPGKKGLNMVSAVAGLAVGVALTMILHTMGVF